MNAKRTFSVSITLALLLQLLPMVSAAAETSPTPSFKSLFRQASAHLGLAQRTLLKLDSAVRVLGYHLHKPRTTHGLYDMLAEVREQLHNCVDNLSEACTRLERLYNARRLLMNAQQDKIATIALVLQAVQTRFNKFHGILEIVIHRINILRDDGAISDVDASFMNSKLDACDQASQQLQEKLLQIEPLLQAGDTENVRDFIEAALHGLRFSASVATIDEPLEAAHILVGQALGFHAQLAVSVAECRGLLSEIQTIVRELRSHCAIHCPRGSGEGMAFVSHPISQMNTRLGAYTQAQVFTLAGRLVREISAANEVFVLDSLALPNGVYLLVFTSKSESDRMFFSKIRKMVINR